MDEEDKEKTLAQKESITEHSSNGHTVVLAGVEHTNSLADIPQSLDKFAEVVKRPNTVFLGEGGGVDVARKLFAENSGMEPGEVIFAHGDHVLMPYLALQKGLEVGNWDLSIPDQLKLSTQRFGAENTSLWFLSQAFIRLRSIDKVVTLTNVFDMMHEMAGTEATQIQDALDGQLKDQPEADKLLIEKLGMSWEDVATDEERWKKFTNLASPLHTENELTQLSETERQVVAIPAEMGRIRDGIALNKIREKTIEGKNVFVSCGKTHADSLQRRLT